MTNGYAIGEVAEKTGVSVHTLRYYERIGLVSPVGREANGRRAYDDGDVNWVHMLTLLRATGMGIRDMQAFAELTRAGDHTVPARIAVLERHRAAMEHLMSLYAQHLDRINRKIAIYRSSLDATTTKEEAS
ncbi:MAG: transcriptional regulator, MerR family [Frankiales bacterium]|nr:transcriptional regulator, MerR family [Frankiales bacterium]